jgi:hypothetical protein
VAVCGLRQLLPLMQTEFATTAVGFANLWQHLVRVALPWVNQKVRCYPRLAFISTCVFQIGERRVLYLYAALAIPYVKLSCRLCKAYSTVGKSRVGHLVSSVLDWRWGRSIHSWSPRAILSYCTESCWPRPSPLALDGIYRLDCRIWSSQDLVR